MGCMGIGREGISRGPVSIEYVYLDYSFRLLSIALSIEIP